MEAKENTAAWIQIGFKDLVGHSPHNHLQDPEQETMAFVKARFGFVSKNCGLCQTGLPCEAHIPLRESRRQR